MSKTIFLIAFLFLLALESTRAQYVSPSTPSASSLEGKTLASQAGVDFFTGTANISIPIHDYTVDGLNLGVSLNYSAQGIKVDQLASSIGLGWSLAYGSSIERIVNGVEDEVTLPGHVASQEQRGRLVGLANNFPYSQREQESDEFYVTIGGKSFKMQLDLEAYPARVTTFPQNDIRVEIKSFVKGTNGSYTSGYDFYQHGGHVPININEEDEYIEFEIIDESGNKFFFTRGDYEKKYHKVEHNGVNYSYYYYPTTRWVLKKIVTFTGQEINYEYTVFNNIGYAQYFYAQVKETFPHANIGGTCSATGNIVVNPESGVKNWTGALSHLSKITYPNGTILKCNLENTNQRCDLTGSYVLDNITIEKGYNATVTNKMTYKFNYGYFNSPIAGTSIFSNIEVPYGVQSCSEYLTILANEGLSLEDRWRHLQLGLRLKLKSLDIVGTDNVSSEKYYSFDYDSQPLPYRLSGSQDYFGYFNGESVTPLSITNGGVTTNYELPVSKHLFQWTSGTLWDAKLYGVDKKSVFSKAKACVLTKVTNALGGATELFYKDHVLSNPSVAYGNSNPIDPALEGSTANDGICIDKIVSSDGFSDANNVTKEYSFSGGQRFFQGGYTWEGVPIEGFSGVSSTDMAEKTYYQSYISSIDYFHGSNHGYSNCIERVISNTGEQLRKTEYEYTNLVEGSTSCLQLTTGILHHRRHGVMLQQKMGLLKELNNYDENNLVRSKDEFEYSINVVPPTSSVGNYIHSNPLSFHTQQTVCLFGAYANVDDDFYRPVPFSTALLTKKKSTTFSGGASLVASTDYTYDSDHGNRLQSETWTDSKGTTYERKFEYIYDKYSASAFGPFKNKIGEYVYRKNPDLLVDCKVASFEIDYASGTSAYENQLRCVNVSAATLNKPTTLADALVSGTIKVIKEYNPLMRDNKKNILETRHNNLEQYSSKIWDTRIGALVAEVSNARYQDIAHTSFEGSFLSGLDFNKGNWTFDPNYVELGGVNSNPKPITGRYRYHLSSGSTVTSLNDLSDRTYVITFWSTGTPTVSFNGTSYPPKQLNQVNSWKLYQVVIVGNNTNKVSISSPTTIFLDELRMRPLEATMTTFTYEPLFGVSSICDDRNDIIYTEYDAFGRERLTSDINGNILQLRQYTKQGLNN